MPYYLLENSSHCVILLHSSLKTNTSCTETENPKEMEIETARKIVPEKNNPAFKLDCFL